MITFKMSFVHQVEMIHSTYGAIQLMILVGDLLFLK